MEGINDEDAVLLVRFSNGRGREAPARCFSCQHSNAVGRMAKHHPLGAWHLGTVDERGHLVTSAGLSSVATPLPSLARLRTEKPPRGRAAGTEVESSREKSGSPSLLSLHCGNLAGRVVSHFAGLEMVVW